MADSESPNVSKRNLKADGTSSAEGLEEFDMSVPTYPYKSSSEYAAAVNQWLWQCYNWQCFSMTLPYIVSQTALRIQSSNPDGSTDFNRNFPNTFFPNQNFALQQSNRPNAANQNSYISDSSGRVFLIPSLFKRLAAEVIDFFVLLIIKVAISYIAVEFFDLVNFSKYKNIDKIIKHEEIDYQTAMEVTSEILALEILNRFIVCIFETVFTYRGITGGGGATPGKTFMNLIVVSCDSVTQIDSNTIRVYPAGDLGLGWALVRSFIKNFSYAFIFPICCTMYFFQHNRTAYDHICGSIVVEVPDSRPHRA